MHTSENQSPKGPKRLGKGFRTVAFVIVALLVVWMIFHAQPAKVSAVASKSSDTNSLSAKDRLAIGPSKIRTTLVPHQRNQTSGAAAYATLTNQPMRLTRKVLVSKKWNNGPDSFGLDTPPPGKEGATIGPAAVTYFQGKLYVLDNPNKRILAYDEAGNLLSSINLPNNVATDLSVDASGTALILIDHMHDKVYRVDGNQLTLLSSVPLKENFPLGTKFSYDPASDTLSTQEVHQDGLADIDGNNLILNLKNGEKLGIPFDKPVACVEEIVTDSNGIMWVLYTLEGDYQMRRIARVDPARGTVGTTTVDVYFSFDATRHMAATGNGIVLFGGDNNEGRLISFNYAGTSF